MEEIGLCQDRHGVSKSSRPTSKLGPCNLDIFMTTAQFLLRKIREFYETRVVLSFVGTVYIGLWARPVVDDWRKLTADTGWEKGFYRANTHGVAYWSMMHCCNHRRNLTLISHSYLIFLFIYAIQKYECKQKYQQRSMAETSTNSLQSTVTVSRKLINLN